MSDINLNWLIDNFSNKHAVIYDIGCADIMTDANQFKELVSNSIVYAFECAEHWKMYNTLMADKLGIHYYHIAMAGHNDGVTFYPSEKNHEQDWPWSGSIFTPDDHLVNAGLTFGETYSVPSITLTEFCKDHPVPNFIHIDAQGAEYTIFKDMQIRPDVIWAEISAFHLYDTNVTYKQFDEMMKSHGYSQEYLSDQDALYILTPSNFTSYPDSTKYSHE